MFLMRAEACVFPYTQVAQLIYVVESDSRTAQQRQGKKGKGERW